MNRFHWAVNPDGIAYLIASEGDRDAWRRTALFRVSSLLEVAESDSETDLCEAAIEALGWYEFGSTAGHAFASCPGAKVEGASRRWVRVVQHGGLDI